MKTVHNPVVERMEYEKKKPRDLVLGGAIITHLRQSTYREEVCLSSRLPLLSEGGELARDSSSSRSALSK